MRDKLTRYFETQLRSDSVESEGQLQERMERAHSELTEQLSSPLPEPQCFNGQFFRALFFVQKLETANMNAVVLHVCTEKKPGLRSYAVDLPSANFELQDCVFGKGSFANNLPDLPEVYFGMKSEGKMWRMTPQKGGFYLLSKIEESDSAELENVTP